eukprot:TRINITY_DN16118_c0_g1_i1.p1 TRINITY_DN16118_c0_g1~~TRINITY_DN16118_c0_g1_i1.p1  ORF type:complete len:1159 (+),score=277.46 TRINITY_DN16118_c0_g1_i1:36-3512(+)
MAWAAVLLCSAAGSSGVPLMGSGSTLLCSLMKDRWLPTYEQSDVGELIEYDCVGSSDGRLALLAGEVDFAGTDMPFPEDDFAQHEDLQMIPIALEAVVIPFNLPGVTTVTLDRPTLGRIFIGSIHFWDDPEIARWNPTLTLPHEPIRVHVRSGSSGTTSIITKALVAFGTWNATRGAGSTWYTDDELPHPGMNLTRVKGSSGMLAAVKDTPYSIGYSGQTGTVAKRLPYASVVNKAGESAAAGRIGGKANAQYLPLHPTRLTGDIVDRLGYPIAGLSYLAVRTRSARACDAVQFALWVLRGGAGLHDGGMSGVYQLFGELATPLGAEAAELVVERVVPAACGGAPNASPQYYLPLAMRDPHEPTHLSSALRAVAYRNYAERNPDLMIVPSPDGATHALAHDRPSFPPFVVGSAAIAGHTAFPFAVGMLVVCASVNVGGVLRTLRMDLALLRRLLTGNVTRWDDPEVAASNPFLYETAARVVWAGDGALESHLTVAAALDIDAADVVRPESVANSVFELARYVRDTHGAVAVVPPEVADAWGLVKIVPTSADGAPLLDDLPTLEAQMQRVAAATGRLPWELRRGGLETYPFYTVARVWVPTRIVPPASLGSTCSAAQELMYPFLTWLVHGEGAEVELRNHGFAPTWRVVEATLRHQDGDGWGTRWQGLMCGDARAFPEPEGAGASWISPEFALPVVGAAVLAAAAGLGYAQWKSRRQARMTRFAPKEGSVAIVFTDILSSSALWAAHPDAMKVALEAHDATVRQALDRCMGYEVKTIGDSFMAAFDSPVAAVEFMMSVQLDLLAVAWPHALLHHPACGVEKDAEGNVLFNGLRLRMGCHVGSPTVRKTPQGGYDYTGGDVNVASRVSDAGAGGQIVITEAVYRAVEEALEDMVCAVDVDLLGSYVFRGIPEALTVYGVSPAHLGGRTFEGLRGVLKDEGDDKTSRVGDGAIDSDKTLFQEVGGSTTSMQRRLVDARRGIRKWAALHGARGVPPEAMAELLGKGCDGLTLTERQVVMLTMHWAKQTLALCPPRRAQGGKPSGHLAEVLGSSAGLDRTAVPIGGGKLARVAPSAATCREHATANVSDDGFRWPAIHSLLSSFPAGAVVQIADNLPQSHALSEASAGCGSGSPDESSIFPHLSPPSIAPCSSEASSGFHSIL